MTTTQWPQHNAQVQFHVLAFEGPDPYAQASGIASRMTGLTQILAATGFETHLWFIGDPDLPGHETRDQLRLHRWCQWLSRAHPEGVYAGEEAKQDDYATSLPPFLLREVLLPHLRQGQRAVILAEEWHTVHAVLHLDWLLRQAGVRHQVTIFWNTNNTFSFHRIDWSRLAQAAVITTVSRYMKHLMQGLGVQALAMPNGLSADAFLSPERQAVAEFRTRLRDRVVITKMARWDPDKRWLLAIDTVSAVQRQGWRPLFIARGGMEAHGAEVIRAAIAKGLRVVERPFPQPGPRGLLRSVGPSSPGAGPAASGSMHGAALCLAADHPADFTPTAAAPGEGPLPHQREPCTTTGLCRRIHAVTWEDRACRVVVWVGSHARQAEATAQHRHRMCAPLRVCAHADEEKSECEMVDTSCADTA
jgi:hypothetical protein